MPTGEQLSLDSAGVVDVRRSGRGTVEERFERWQHDNPGILTEVADVTRAMSRHDGQAPTIAEVWQEFRRRRITTGPKRALDNSLRRPAAEAVMDRYPDLAGTFRLRGKTAR